MPARPPLTITVTMPLSFTDTERRKVGEAVIDHIRTRSKRGIGVGGKQLKGPDGDGRYSDNYVDSSEFEAAGKTKGKVNLTFSGEMLFDMEVQSTGPGRVVIGFSNSENSDKATFLKEKNYDWFGISEDERQMIVSRVVGGKVADIDTTLASSFLQRLFRG